MTTKATDKKARTKGRSGVADPGTEIDLTDPAESSTRNMQAWFDRWADGLGMRLPDMFGNRLPEAWGAGRELGGVIRIEEIVDDEGITIRGELPGIDPNEDIEITFENGRLDISAERRHEEESEVDGRRRTEFRYGSYRRSLALPAGTDGASITATYDNGILEVRVPVDEGRAEAAKIPIETS